MFGLGWWKYFISSRKDNTEFKLLQIYSSRFLLNLLIKCIFYCSLRGQSLGKIPLEEASELHRLPVSVPLLAGCFTDTYFKYNFSFGILKVIIQLKNNGKFGQKVAALKQTQRSAKRNES